MLRLSTEAGGEAAATLAARAAGSQQPAGLQRRRQRRRVVEPVDVEAAGRRRVGVGRANRRRTAARRGSRPARSAVSAKMRGSGLQSPTSPETTMCCRRPNAGLMAKVPARRLGRHVGQAEHRHAARGQRLDRRLGLGDRAGEHLPPARLPGDDRGLVLRVTARSAARGSRRTARRRRGARARPSCRRWPGTSRARPGRGRSWNRGCADPSAR